MMQKLSANEAKTHFGELLLKAQSEPIGINKNGKPVAVVMSVEAFEALETIKYALLKERLAQANQEIANDALIDGQTFFSSLSSR